MTYKNERLKGELINEIYDIVGEGIKYTKKSQNYKKYDVAKLLLAIYENDFDYLAMENDYKDQIKTLDDYFVMTFNHRVITLEIIKTFLSNNLEEVIKDVISIKKIISLDEEDKLSQLFKEEEYDKIMELIENEKDLRYAVCIVYDKIIS